MAAPKGNTYWKLAKNAGRPKIFTSPEEFWKKACEYFEWCDANPYYKTEQVKAPQRPIKDKEGNYIFQPNLVNIPTQRPYTIDGLCVFLNISNETFYNYSGSEEWKEYFDIFSRVRKIIETQQFEGAAVGVFNHAIIARKLGLGDKQQVDAKVEGGLKFTFNLNATDEQR